jgi:hypothetical protein
LCFRVVGGEHAGGQERDADEYRKSRFPHSILPSVIGPVRTDSARRRAPRRLE